jgi:protein SCO1/2
MRLALALGALVVGVALVVGFAASRPAPQAEGARSGLFDPPRVAPDFDLRGSNGARVVLKNLRGKVVILEFGFTYCQEVCPVTLAKLVEVYQELGDAAKEVQLVFVTVDPDRDTPERLAEYLGAMHPAFLGATEAPAELEAMRKAYGVAAEKVISDNPRLGYQVNHSSFLYLIDREGMLRGLVPFGRPAEEVVHDVRFLLKR